MLKIVYKLSIHFRRAIHGLVICLPQGLRTTLSNSTFLTRIFLYFDDARYTSLHSGRTLFLSTKSSTEHRPFTQYDYIAPDLTKKVEKRLRNFGLKPLISIIMPVFNVDPKWLKLAIQSIENQWYDNWELYIADDSSSNQETIDFLESIKNPKIRINYLPENKGISTASNQALTMANGEYITLIDHDDELTPDALYEVVKAINEQDAEVSYSDEDKLSMDGTYREPHFKPDYSPDMFLSQNYLSHLGVIKKTLIDKVGGFTVGLEGAQDYDLYLKVLEHTDKVAHIAKVLYHWRKIPGSTAADFDDKSYAGDAGARALRLAVERRHLNAQVLNGKYPGTYRVKYAIENDPMVSIIIPFKDKPELLKMCIESILKKSTYRNFEIIGVSNNSKEKETFAEMERLKALDARVSFFEHNLPFNFAGINNYAVRTHAKGEHILLLNNDIEIISKDWIESLLEFSQRQDVGVVGGKLYYPDDRVQHAGIVIGIGGIAGHSHKYIDREDHGYFSRPHLVQNMSALTGACFMVKKNIYEEVGGLDAENLKIAFNDVDFCLRIREKGYLNVFTPYCEAYHHESLSRGYETTAEQVDRFNKESEYMLHRHASLLESGDPYYNLQLTIQHEDFSLATSE